MPAIFSSQAGVVAKVDGLTVPMTVTLDNPAIANLPLNLVKYKSWGGFDSLSAIITGISISEKCATQIIHSLGLFQYIYGFGDRAGDLTVNGIGFIQSCANPSVNFGGINVTAGNGFDSLINYFTVNRFSNRGLPVNVTLGTTFSVKAFLLDFRLDITDASTKLSQFVLMFKYPPRPNV